MTEAATGRGGLGGYGFKLPAINDRQAFKASLFNARSESAAEKASFKGPLRYKRTIVPDDGFFEWKRKGSTKTPYDVQLPDGEPVGLAGLYDVWHDGRMSCTISTTPPMS